MKRLLCITAIMAVLITVLSAPLFTTVDAAKEISSLAATSSSVSVEMHSANTAETTNNISFKMKITNTGSKSIDLSDLELRYYYTIDGAKDQSFWCDWASVGNSKITGRFVKMKSPKKNADYYLEIGFDSGAGSLAAKSSTEIQIRFSKEDWSNYKQSNDYSFNSSSSVYSRWNKVTAHLDGELIWGETPSGEAAPTPKPTNTPKGTATPTPAGTRLRVNIEEENGKKGDSLYVSVDFSNVPSQGIDNLSFDLDYDEDVLKFLSVKPGSIVNDSDYMYFNHDSKKGVIYLYYMNENSSSSNLIKKNGEFAQIRFEILNTSFKGLSKIEAGDDYEFEDKNLNNIRVTFSDGGIRVGQEATRKPTSTPKPTPKPAPVSSNYEHKKYLSGYPDGSFKPEKEITRAEAAVIFSTLLEISGHTYSGNNTGFSDVDNSHWALESIKWVTKEGLFRGYTDGTFRPNQIIKRGEFAAVIYNFLGMDGSTANRSFLDTKTHWAGNIIEELAELNYITGYSDGTFKPEEVIRRAECIVIINKALKRGPLNGASQTFTDVPKQHWAFRDIAEATMDHYFTTNKYGIEFIEN